MGTPPSNADFSTGDLTGWTTAAGSPTIQTDPNHGSYVRLPVGAAVTSSAFVVDATAQAIVVDVYHLPATSFSGIEVYVLSGATFATSTRIAQVTCSNCGVWTPVNMV